MKNLLFVLCFSTLVALLPPAAASQTNFVLSSFQSDPSSCVEQTPPTVVGTAFVSYSATCTGGIIASIEGSAKAQIGVNAPCSSLYVAEAQVTTRTQTFTDDCGDPYDISTIITTETILSPLNVEVFSVTQGISCDNATSGPFDTGTAPC